MVIVDNGKLLVRLLLFILLLFFFLATIVSLFGAGAAPFLTAPAPAPAPSKPFRRLRLRLRLRPKCVGSGGSGSGSGSGSASLGRTVPVRYNGMPSNASWGIRSTFHFSSSIMKKMTGSFDIRSHKVKFEMNKSGLKRCLPS